LYNLCRLKRLMDIQLLLNNLSNPALLFFFLGIIASQLKSDLEIPGNSSKFISLYLLFSIGFKGGQELSHSVFGEQVVYAVLFGVLSALIIPVILFPLLRVRFTIENAGAIAASYGSISAVTFITAISFLELSGVSFSGHMVAIMALMEAPAIIMGVLLIRLANKEKTNISMRTIFKHALTNGSVLLILGSLVIGFIASDSQAAGIKPFTTDIFKGFLAIFLLDMGIKSGREIRLFFKKGVFAVAFAIVVPLIIGVLTAYFSCHIIDQPGDRLLMTVLAASASYIAVPAAMQIVVPKASPSLYIPMALAVTFPMNITIGLPIYYFIIQC